MENPATLIRWALHVFRFTGTHPMQNKILRISMSSLYLLFAFTSNALTVANFYHVNDLSEALSNMEGFTMVSQLSLKVIMLLVYKDDLVYLIKMNEVLWKASSGIPRIDMKVNSIVRKLKVLFYFLIVMVLPMMVMIIRKAYFLKQLPVSGYIPVRNDNLYLCIATWQIFLLLVNITIVGSCDVFINCYCISLALQFYILNRKLIWLLQRIKADSTCYETLREYAVHHNLLLECFYRLRRICSVYFLAVLFTIILTICVECYALTEMSVEYGRLAINLMSIITITVQLANYCLAANELTEQAFEISRSIYNTGWHTGRAVKFKAYLLMIMMRAQKPIAFTAGGMIDINRATLTFVFKTSMSVYTTMKSLKAK